MLKSFQLEGSPMNKVDEVDSAGNPICVVTYSSGLTENSIVLDAQAIAMMKFGRLWLGKKIGRCPCRARMF